MRAGKIFIQDLGVQQPLFYIGHGALTYSDHTRRVGCPRESKRSKDHAVSSLQIRKERVLHLRCTKIWLIGCHW